MRVEVNTDLCQGHNRCYALAPELFDVDDYGTAVVIGDGTGAPELEDKARRAGLPLATSGSRTCTEVTV